MMAWQADFNGQNVKGGGGGGQTFFRAFINSELGLPEVAPCMARTFGGVSGHRRRTGSEPHPAQIWSQKYPYLPDGPRRPRWVPNCSPCPSDQPHISIYGSTMKIVDARAISV